MDRHAYPFSQCLARYCVSGSPGRPAPPTQPPTGYLDRAVGSGKRAGPDCEAGFTLPDCEAGFTLIELMVSLLLFALISIAGISLVETMTRLQRSTVGRAERLADVQRALFLITTDFGQISDDPVLTAQGVGLMRTGADRIHQIVYRQDRFGLHREVDGKDRLLLSGVSRCNWRFAKHGGWTAAPATPEDGSRPKAVELTLELQSQGVGLTGSLRRVIELPARP